VAHSPRPTAPGSSTSRSGIPLQGASDHGVSEAIYLSDPDGNGIELYWDRPKEEWPHKPDGELDMPSNPLDIDGLLAEAA
jgi:catechol 2,3-dioxygenase